MFPKVELFGWFQVTSIDDIDGSLGLPPASDGIRTAEGLKGYSSPPQTAEACGNEYPCVEGKQGVSSCVFYRVCRHAWRVCGVYVVVFVGVCVILCVSSRVSSCVYS